MKLSAAAARLAASGGASLLLAAIFVQMVTAIPDTSAVVDEPAHLTAGYLSLVRGDLSINKEHPPLLKALAAVPLLWMHPVLPEPDPSGPPPGTEDFEFHYARDFLYHANDADRLLAAARMPIILLTVLLGAIVFVWTRDVAGPLPALAALTLVAFQPEILAHGRLVTTDLGAALFVLATLWTLRMTVRGGSPVAAAACGAFLGLALLSKFSTLLLLPIGLALAVADRLLDRDPDRPRPGGERLAILAAVIVCTAWAILLAGYRFGGFPLPHLYTEGIALAHLKNQTVEGPTYLMGRISPDGFLSYFVVALLVKLPIPTILLVIAGGAAAIASARWRREAIWLAGPAVAWIAAMSLLTKAQIGVRYVLPAIPLLCALAGVGVAALAGRAGRATRAKSRRLVAATAVVTVLLLGWQAASVIAAHPYHLAYFNELAGGRDQGWRWLVDSNVDWGQDLVGLRRWQQAEGDPPVNLYYFGTADPDYYGLVRYPYGQAHPGWFAVSATHLAGVYLPRRDYFAVLRDRVPDQSIGGSIFLYHLDPVPPELQQPLTRSARR